MTMLSNIPPQLVSARAFWSFLDPQRKEHASLAGAGSAIGVKTMGKSLFLTCHSLTSTSVSQRPVLPMRMQPGLRSVNSQQDL